MALVTEDHVELQSIEWFKELGYKYVCGYDIALDGEDTRTLRLSICIFKRYDFLLL